MNPQQLSTEQWLTVILGVGGGLGVAKMGYEHLRVEGVSEEERRGMLKVAGTAALTAALLFLVEVPKHYVVLDEETWAYWSKRLDIPDINLP